MAQYNGLDYIDSKVVHNLRMGLDAGYDKRTGASTTRTRLAERGDAVYFVAPGPRLKALARRGNHFA
jgi:hypothetical protein